MTDEAKSEPATVVHGAATEVEVAAVHAALIRHGSGPGGPLDHLAQWRRRRLVALAETPRCR
jgi:hypothetical protein